MKEKLFTRNFTLLLLGQVFSLLGNGALRFALSMYVLEKTGSAAVFGTLLAVSMVPTILLTSWWGLTWLPERRCWRRPRPSRMAGGWP